MSAPPVTDAPHLLNLCHLFDETHNSISLYALSLRLRTPSGTVYPIARTKPGPTTRDSVRYWWSPCRPSLR
jgi:hypothetical protein